MAEIVSLAPVSVTTTVTELVGAADISAKGGGTSFEIYNEDATATVLIGGTGLTSANGIPLSAGASKVYFLAPGQVLSGKTTTGTIVCRRLKIED
jgi:hypothetical protein